MSYKAIGISLLLLLGSFGCTQVQPWEKEALSLPYMAFDPDPLEARFVRHVYESKEASSGGYSADAGGCGCN